MKTILQIRTRSPDELADLAAGVRDGGDVHVETIDFTISDPDYSATLDAIFGADSIQVW